MFDVNIYHYTDERVCKLVALEDKREIMFSIFTAPEGNMYGRCNDVNKEIHHLDCP